MKVTLDLSRLLADGAIDSAEFEKLRRLGQAGTRSVGFNILIGFGVVAVSAGLIALVPNALTGVALGAVLLAGGLALHLARQTAWDILANILILVGALLFAAGLIIVTDASAAAFLAVTAGFIVAALAARSALLMVLALLALSSSLGAHSGYLHATYFLGIEQPTWTILAFAVIALGAYQVARRAAPDTERLAVAAVRTSVFLINFAFWIGSLWGDRAAGSTFAIPSWTFAVGWAVVLVVAAVWAARVGRAWLVNVAAVFGAIHFYTQWFERLGPEPGSIVLGGLVALMIAGGLWWFNRRRLRAA